MKSGREKLNSYYFTNPSDNVIERKLEDVKLRYLYFNNQLSIQSESREVVNGCLLEGKGTLKFQDKNYEVNKFDIFFLPPKKSILIKLEDSITSKICLMQYHSKKEVNAKFELIKYDVDEFIPRGEHSSSNLMSTYRTVWTAIKNGYFMSGFTNIPTSSLKEGTITSVNLEKSKNGNEEIYAHIHPGNPEVYIACIDDKKYALTQYLISQDGFSVCRDIMDGEGAFFPGECGHSNFARPTYRNLQYCMYLWMIPTYGKSYTVNPITLK
jgi:hypothetical protein